MAKYVVAKTSAWVNQSIFINEGELWDGDDPVVRSRPDLFTDDPKKYARRTVRAAEAPVEAPVEAATANPGEKRTTTAKGSTQK